MHHLQGEKGDPVTVKTLWLVPAALILDQASKYMVEHTLSRGGPPISVLGNFFRLTYIHNPGAAFGLNIGSPHLHTFISIFALGVLIWLFWTLPKDDRLLRVGLALVLGGAVGNIIDRFRLGEVIDFLDVGIGTLRWPVFNFADSFVTVGIGLLALGYARKKEEAPADQDGPQCDQALEG